MPSPSEVLSKVQVAKPCPADWREMVGDDRVRHCELCRRHVYNLSEMSREEAAALIQGAEGRLCVRYFLREDGKVMTKDCGKPIPLEKPLRALLIGLAAVFGTTLLCMAASFQAATHRSATPLDKLVDKVTALCNPAPPAPKATPMPLMGDIAPSVAKRP